MIPLCCRDFVLADVWINPLNPHERLDHAAKALTTPNPAVCVAPPEQAESLPQFWTYAAATRVQAM
jgi:hypothetical protein